MCLADLLNEIIFGYWEQFLHSFFILTNKYGTWYNKKLVRNWPIDISWSENFETAFNSQHYSEWFQKADFTQNFTCTQS